MKTNIIILYLLFSFLIACGNNHANNDTKINLSDIEIKQIYPKAVRYAYSSYTIEIGDNSLRFDYQIVENGYYDVFLNDKKLTQKQLEDYSELEKSVFYNRSDYYIVNNDYYLIISKPFLWEDLNSECFYYQFIDIKNEIITDFISYENYPDVFKIEENKIVIIRPENYVVCQKTKYFDYDNVTITSQEMVLFFEHFRELLLQEKAEQLADLVMFPLHGDCFWYMAYTEEEREQLEDERFERNDFIERYKPIFNENFISLITKIDFKKTFEDDYKVSMLQSETMPRFIEMSVDYETFEDENQRIYFTRLNLSSIDEFEHTIMFFFKKTDGKIKLYSIRCAG